MKDYRATMRVDATNGIAFAGIALLADSEVDPAAVEDAIEDTAIDRRCRLVAVYDPDPALACLLPVYDHL